MRPAFPLIGAVHPYVLDGHRLRDRRHDPARGYSALPEHLELAIAHRHDRRRIAARRRPGIDRNVHAVHDAILGIREGGGGGGTGEAEARRATVLSAALINTGTDGEAFTTRVRAPGQNAAASARISGATSSPNRSRSPMPPTSHGTVWATSRRFSVKILPYPVWGPGTRSYPP